MSACQERGVYSGGCHCGSVRFRVSAPPSVKVVVCDCSICSKKQLRYFIVEDKYFHLLSGSENLTVYTFNTGRAKHYFCKTCGVESFYKPRSNPEGIGVMHSCLDSEPRPRYEEETFHGIDWENQMKNNPSASLLS